KIFLRDLNVFASYFHLASRCFQVEMGLSDVRFYLGASVFEFGLALCQNRLGLLNVSFDPASLPDWEFQAAHYRKRSMGMRRIGSDCTIIGTERDRRKTFGACCRLRSLCGTNLGFRRFQIRAPFKRLFESVFAAGIGCRREGDIIGELVSIVRW